VLSARTIDKYALYTDAVQSPTADVEFFRRLYEKLNGRRPLRLREDFCGTAAICCQWVYSHPHALAVGVDKDPKPLQWTRKNFLKILQPEQAGRIQLRRGDVLRIKSPRADVICALNFSFCIFKMRKVLLSYLNRCRERLARGGIMVMDIYGGPDAQQPQEMRTRKKGYTCVWDQARYNPLTSEVLNHLHFFFPDGTRIMKAFTYDWRLWTITELQEALCESGFREARVYWEDLDRKGQRTGVYRNRKRVDPQDAWVAYIVGLR